MSLLTCKTKVSLPFQSGARRFAKIPASFKSGHLSLAQKRRQSESCFSVQRRGVNEGEQVIKSPISQQTLSLRIRVDAQRRRLRRRHSQAPLTRRFDAFEMREIFIRAALQLLCQTGMCGPILATASQCVCSLSLWHRYKVFSASKPLSRSRYISLLCQALVLSLAPSAVAQYAGIYTL